MVAEGRVIIAMSVLVNCPTKLNLTMDEILIQEMHEELRKAIIKKPLLVVTTVARKDIGLPNAHTFKIKIKIQIQIKINLRPTIHKVPIIVTVELRVSPIQTAELLKVTQLPKTIAPEVIIQQIKLSLDPLRQ